MKTQVVRKPALSVVSYDVTAFLDQDEQSHLRTLSAQHVHDFLAGRFVLKQLFRDAFKQNARLTEIGILQTNGRPTIRYKGRLYRCSLSHTKEYVACAIDAVRHVGIDVEMLRERAPELRAHICDRDESELCFGLGTYSTVRIWTIKEAAFKSDRQQVPLSSYKIVGTDRNYFKVRNTVSQDICRVKNNIIANYTVSYTI